MIHSIKHVYRLKSQSIWECAFDYTNRINRFFPTVFKNDHAHKILNAQEEGMLVLWTSEKWTI